MHCKLEHVYANHTIPIKTRSLHYRWQLCSHTILQQVSMYIKNQYQKKKIMDNGKHPGGYTRHIRKHCMKGHINGLVQERRNSSALAMELRLSCTNPAIYDNNPGLDNSTGPITLSNKKVNGNNKIFTAT